MEHGVLCSDTAQQSTLREVSPATSADAAAVGFVLAHLETPQKASGPVLWVQDRLSRLESGRPFLGGLAGFREGAFSDILYVNTQRPADVLWAMEEGLRCKALSAVIGEIWGDPVALNFTATKRLAMRAEASGVNAWLIRRAATANLSAARDRWRVASLPAEADPYDAEASGSPRWQAELFRSRDQKPGTWVVRYNEGTDHDQAAHRLHLAVPLPDGTLAATGTADHTNESKKQRFAS